MEIYGEPWPEGDNKIYILILFICFCASILVYRDLRHKRCVRKSPIRGINLPFLAHRVSKTSRSVFESIK